MDRLENCICSWVAEPIEVKYDYESVSEIEPQRFRTGASYVRAMVHHINPECTIHAWLLNPIGYGVGKPLPKISRIAVDAVPLANRPELDHDHKVHCSHIPTCEGWMPPVEAMPAEGYEVLVEEGGVTSRKTISLDIVDGGGGRIDTGSGTYTWLPPEGEADVDRLVERAREVWEEFRHENGEHMKWVIDYAKAMTTDERERIRYEARKRSEWYFCPLDDPMGQGHCRHCHHDCRFEGCSDIFQNTGEWDRCNEPACGHTAGCPGC